MSLLLFRLDGSRYAVDLADIREVVRLGPLRPVPGAEPPLRGLLDVRGSHLAVHDARAEPGGRGDVLLLDRDGETVGVACDGVEGLSDAGPAPAPPELPSYVLGALAGRGDVLVVDLWGLLAALVGAPKRPRRPTRARSSASAAAGRSGSPRALVPVGDTQPGPGAFQVVTSRRGPHGGSSA